MCHPIDQFVSNQCTSRVDDFLRLCRSPSHALLCSRRKPPQRQVCVCSLSAGRPSDAAVLQAPEGGRVRASGGEFAQTAAPSGSGGPTRRSDLRSCRFLEKRSGKMRRTEERKEMKRKNISPPPENLPSMPAELRPAQPSKKISTQMTGMTPLPFPSLFKTNTSLRNECIHGCLVRSATRLLCFNERSRYSPRRRFTCMKEEGLRKKTKNKDKRNASLG